jgi:hypothetical protein
MEGPFEQGRKKKTRLYLDGRELAAAKMHSGEDDAEEKARFVLAIRLSLENMALN